jgi:hypothetical protein
MALGQLLLLPLLGMSSVASELVNVGLAARGRIVDQVGH